MTIYEKPALEIADVRAVLNSHMGSDVAALTRLEGGNMDGVFSFIHEGKDGVIKFSRMQNAYETDRFVMQLLTQQGVSFPQCIGQGNAGTMEYLIMNRIPGRNLIECTDEQKESQLPELIEKVVLMNNVHLGTTSGYGSIKPDGNGSYSSWNEYILSFFAEDQTGNFWEGWYDLFDTTCLQRDVFEECYARLLAYSSYNEPHRHFIHGDFHPWNILSDGHKITGFIDGNFAYGDFLIDLATLTDTLGTLDVVEAYKEYNDKAGIIISNFKERLIGARYFKGLDGLRFFAKMGWNDAYTELRDSLLKLTD
ncbi:hygromycin-B 4-O-kinase [Paenibacillaceae bacterium GAS479]|nr:hygromycin-B 4-O-kinase [Paenibacillaceae bacterium GAS479]